MKTPLLILTILAAVILIAIVAMHFNGQMAYTLRFLTHAEYDRDDWKDEL